MTRLHSKMPRIKRLLSAFLLVTGGAALADQAMATVVVTNVARFSRNAAGVQGNDFSKNPVFSADGKKIAFESKAFNLVPGDTNLRYDIFVKNLATGAITRVSTSSSNAQANDDSGQPVFSPDGKKIAFRSYATNLASGGGFQSHIYVKDLVTGAVTRVSTTAGGNGANGFSFNPVFSPNSKLIAFESDATNLVSSDGGLYRDVFVKNLVTGAVTRVSSNAAGKVGNGESANPVFSPDNTKVAFDSYASNLVTQDLNGYRDVFVKTLASGAISRVSTDAAGNEGPGGSAKPAFSPNGAKVAFGSNWPIVAGDGNNGSDIFVKTLASGAIVRVSNSASNVIGNTESFNPAFSPNGHSIAFISLASNLVPGDTKNFEDVFVKSLTTPAITRVSITSTFKEANGRSWTEDPTGKSYSPVFNPNSNKIVFPSDATNIVSGDSNGYVDIFVVTFSGN